MVIRMRREQVIIIGAGPAGTVAAVQCQRLGVTPLLLDRAGTAGGLAENAYCIENYPGMPKPLGGPQFAESLRAHLARFDLTVGRVEVEGIMGNGREFSVKHAGGEFFARAVILASGTEPHRLDLAGENELDGAKLFYEVRPLLRCHAKPRDVIIVGGGEAACDYALTLASVGATVHLVVRSDRLKARGDLACAVQRAPSIRISHGTRCELIAASPLLTVRLRNSITGSIMELSPDALLVAVGRRSTAPRLLDPLGVPMADCVAGSIPGLFVAGDASIGSLGQIGMAVGDGIRAAAATVAFLENQ
ncbi:MAG: NAD(P)/FAD-dependent oxidoreductase [Candidatus Krumholzibacteria bacterium]|nr:NAD(P)/FAD-dependent oxidoreductase [Candidatus Krumholzibacteria bacterium]